MINIKKALRRKKYKINKPHKLFEQINHYGAIPSTGMELNLREAYDATSRSIRDHVCREAAAEKLAELVNKKTKQLGINKFPDSEEYGNYAKTLKNDGWVTIPDLLNKQQIDDIVNYVKNKPIIDFYNKHKVFYLNDIPQETNVGRYTPEFNLNCPHIFKALNHPSVLKIAEEFLGAKPTMSVVMLMWSFNSGNEAQQMQKFHRDNDDYRFCKVFVLLNDVDGIEDGPHLYIKNSHSQEDVLRLIDKMNISEEEKQQKLKAVFSGVPNHRYPDELINDIFPPDQFKYHTGKRGTSIMENTWGIHRGIPPKRRHRFILQAQYSLQPTPMFTYNPVKIKSNIPNKRDRTIQYVNRMYVKT